MPSCAAAWLLLLLPFVTSQLAAIPCLQPRVESGFLAGVIHDLSTAVRDTFCQDNTPRATANAAELGIRQLVLSGHVPRQLVGKQNNQWQLVRHGDVDRHDTDNLPAVVHLWLKALCIQ